MTGDVQIDTIGTVPYAIQVAVDRLAETLEPYAGWAIRLDIDPGVVLVATPARQLDAATDDTGAPARPPGAPLSPQDGSSAAQPGPTAPDGAQALTEGAQ